MSDGHRGLMLRRIFSLCAQTNVVRDTPDSPTRGNRAVPAAPLPGVVHDRGRRGPGHRSGRQNSPPRSAHLARERRSQEQRTGRHAPRCFRRELGVARRGGHGLGPHPRLRIPCRTRPFGKARTGTIRRNEDVSGPQLSFCDCGPINVPESFRQQFTGPQRCGTTQRGAANSRLGFALRVAR